MHDQPVYDSRMGACNCGRPENAVAVDGLFHLMGDRVCGMGGSSEHPSQALGKALTLTFPPRHISPDFRAVRTPDGNRLYSLFCISTVMEVQATPLVSFHL
jgi:hypothetical protein